VPAPTLGIARRRLRREAGHFRSLGAAPPLSVANSSPPAVLRQQAIAVAETLAGALPVFPDAPRRRDPLWSVPLDSSQSGETVSKERLRFDTRQIEPQRKIALGNINGLTSRLKLIDALFSNFTQKPLWLKDSFGLRCAGVKRVRYTAYWNDGITKGAELRQMLAVTADPWGSNADRWCQESLIVCGRGIVRPTGDVGLNDEGAFLKRPRQRDAVGAHVREKKFRGWNGLLSGGLHEMRHGSGSS
jgi:hypothetical protein